MLHHGAHSTGSGTSQSWSPDGTVPVRPGSREKSQNAKKIELCLRPVGGFENELSDGTTRGSCAPCAFLGPFQLPLLGLALAVGWLRLARRCPGHNEQAKRSGRVAGPMNLFPFIPALRRFVDAFIGRIYSAREQTELFSG